jgi:hypothetical protein
VRCSDAAGKAGAWSLDIFSVTEFRGEGPNRGRDNTEWVVESVPQLNAG